MKRTKTPTNEYDAFRAQLRATPYDAGAWSMFIDWLEEQERRREACVARIALAQRQKFGPLTPGDFVGDAEHNKHNQINAFTRSCRGILHPGHKGGYLWYPTDREMRFRRRCEHQTRLSPKSGLWEWRVVGPDPNVHPLDCPPMDERRRFRQWKPYPDVWYCVWWINPTLNHWEIWKRERMYGDACGVATGLSVLHDTPCVVRDQDGRVDCLFYQGKQVYKETLVGRLPEDEFPDSPV